MGHLNAAIGTVAEHGNKVLCAIMCLGQIKDRLFRIPGISAGRHARLRPSLTKTQRPQSPHKTMIGRTTQ